MKSEEAALSGDVGYNPPYPQQPGFQPQPYPPQQYAQQPPQMGYPTTNQQSYQPMFNPPQPQPFQARFGYTQSYTTTGPTGPYNFNNWRNYQTTVAGRLVRGQCFLCLVVFGVFFSIAGIANLAIYSSLQSDSFFAKHSTPELVMGILFMTLGCLFTISGGCGIYFAVQQARKQRAEPPVAYQMHPGPVGAPVVSGGITTQPSPMSYNSNPSTYNNMEEVPLNSNPCSPTAPGPYLDNQGNPELPPPPYNAAKY